MQVRMGVTARKAPSNSTHYFTDLSIVEAKLGNPTEKKFQVSVSMGTMIFETIVTKVDLLLFLFNLESSYTKSKKN